MPNFEIVEQTHHSPVVARPTDPEPVAYSDADYTISSETAERLLNRKADNTIRAYKFAWRQFDRWCTDEGRIPLPATPQTLCDYAVRLMGMSLSPSTIGQAIGCIRNKHSEHGHKDEPDHERALEMLRRYRREWADAGNRAEKATPILVNALRKMVDTCDPAAPTGARDRAVLLLGFNLMARRSELAALRITDVEEVDDGLNAHIRYSKTDQAAKGTAIGVPYGQHLETCAVRATRAWVAELDKRGLSDGALFRSIDRHGRIAGEAKAAGKVTARLSGKSVSTIVHRRAVLAGLPNLAGYTGHSLRSGAATSAYLAGKPVSEIATQGRWCEHSPVVLGYIRAVDKWQNNPMRGIGL